VRRGLLIPHGASRRDLVHALDSQPTFAGSVNDVRAAALLSLRSTHRTPRSSPAARGAEPSSASAPADHSSSALSSATRVEPEADPTQPCSAVSDAVNDIFHKVSLFRSRLRSDSMPLLRALSEPGSGLRVSHLSDREREFLNGYLVSSCAA
jgi:hypothetical protein